MGIAYFKVSRKVFSLIGVSILGAVAHNFGQLSVAYIVMHNPYVYSYLPVLVLAGLFTGFCRPERSLRNRQSETAFSAERRKRYDTACINLTAKKRIA